MNSRSILPIVIRNLIGFAALVGIHYASDQYNLVHRSGFNKTSPYLFLLLLYGWIVFHNRVLFERLFLKGRKAAYAGWTLLAMSISSFNMYYILHFVFGVNNALPQILSFWVYTITGLGIYVIFKYLNVIEKQPSPVVNTTLTEQPSVTHFKFTVDGVTHNLPVNTILYLESLENYLKVFTSQKSYLVRLSLKEAEEKLPKLEFIRISRSHIVNIKHIISNGRESVRLKDQELKIGKVYKRYVEEQLSASHFLRNSQ